MTETPNELAPPTYATRVCPHCHAQSQTNAKRCPHCNKKFKKRGFFGKLMIGALVFVVLMAVLIGGCAALFSNAVDEVQKDSDKHSISPAEYAATKTGTTRAVVEAKLGKPSNAQEMDIDTSEFKGAGSTQSNDCIYYTKKGEIASFYQFCFTDEKLTAKSSY